MQANPYQPMSPSPNGLEKPSWRNLQGSGRTTPVKEAVGFCDGYGQEPSQYGGIMVMFHLTNLQVYDADAPWPYSEMTLAIKKSDRSDSAWGLFGASAAMARGVDLSTLDVDMLINTWWHIVRHDNHQFGVDRDGRPIVGTVWELAEILQQGQAPNLRAGQRQTGIAPAAAPQTYPTPAMAPQATVAPQVAPQAVPQVTSPTTVTATTAVAPPAPTDSPSVAPAAAVTPEERALALIHDKTLAEFYQAALSDEVIRQDPLLTNAILSQAWVPAKLSSGAITMDETGTYHRTTS